VIRHISAFVVNEHNMDCTEGSRAYADIARLKWQ